MFYYQNSYLYPYNGQFYVLPSIVQSQYPQNYSPFDLKQTASLEEKQQCSFGVEKNQVLKTDAFQLQKEKDSKQRKISGDSDYEPQNNETIVFYKKKNTESNLSNQIYSFISSGRSYSLMLKIFNQDQNKVEQFYKIIKKIKKSNKKYMNRNYIADLVQLKESNTNFKIYKRAKCPLQIEEIRKALRISLKYFIENVCDLGLLTSKKMNKVTLIEHFARKREIKQFLFEGLYSDKEN